MPALDLECALAEPGDDHELPDAACEGGDQCDVRIELHDSLLRLSARVWVRLEIQLATTSIGYVCVQLGRREIRMPEHLLYGT